MVLIREDQKTKRAYVPTQKQARLTVDRGMIYRQYEGVRLADMPDVYPLNHLLNILRDAVRRFIHDMGKMGLEPMHGEGDFIVSGPYRSWKFTRNHKRPDVGVYRESDEYDEGGADMVLTGNFLDSRELVYQTREAS